MTTRPIQTRFRYGFIYVDLTLPLKITRWLIMQKARCHPDITIVGLQLLLSVRFQDLFHSSYRGSFRLSLTVLVHYRSLGNI